MAASSSSSSERVASGSSSGSANGTKAKSRVHCYNIELVSDDLIDCRLQIVPLDGSKARWYQERSLSEQDEIVDRLIDARTGRIAWTSHRPVRGWYLHLQLPSLPREKAIPLLPAKSNQAGCTPLSLTIGTRLDHTALGQVDPLISQPWFGNDTVPERAPPEDNQFTAVALDNHSVELQSQPKTISHARTSSRNQNQGHARRRSGRMSGTVPSSRHVSRSSQVEALQESREDSEDGKVQGTDIEEIHRPRLPLLEISSQPSLCHFLLTDDLQARTSHAQDTWKQWAWKNVPDALRAPLTLDSSSKTFSVLWDNAPLPGGGGNSTVEVVRYEDDAGWLNWRGKRRGRILIQEEAIKALRLDIGFWMAVTLAFLEFLEERDGYHAACEG